MSSVATSIGDVKIVIQFDNYVFTSTSILRFDLVNSMNKIPTGEFVMVDTNSNFVVAKSGDYGTIFFTDTSDNNEEKASAIPFIVDNMSKVENSGSNTSYRVKWTAGTKESIRKTTRAFKGTSLEALMDVCEYHKYLGIEILTDLEFEKPTDSMTWRFIQDNMWEAFHTVVDQSYMKNDYIFWVFDDVNNYIKISSLNLEKSLDDKHLFIYSDNANAATSEVKKRFTEPEVTIWTYNGDIRDNEVDRKKLFPNVSLSGIRETNYNQAGFKKACFSKVLQSMGDSKQAEIQAYTGLDDNRDVFGDLQVVRHWPNNTHKMYSLAKTYRDYKRATYTKIMYLKIYNTLGPSIGSKVSVMALSDDIKVRGENLDTVYTDTYIVSDKQIRFTTIEGTTTGRLKGTGNNELVTIIKLVSDNYGTSGFDETINFINTMKDIK